jgi:hypothetical protein
VKGERLYTHAQKNLERMSISHALRLFNLAERAHFDPDSCAAGRWDCHMLSGNFELAWRESDSIAARGNPDPYRFWDAQSFAGRNVIIRCLHGLGDTIQFIRYVPIMRQQARRVIVEAQPALKSLLEEAQIADSVITWGEAEPHWDQQIEVIELPRVFRTTVPSIPNPVPYLTVPCSVPALNNFGQRLRVGLVWGSSTYNPERSMALRDMTGLFAIPGISFFSLQAGPQRAELAPWSSQIVDLYNESACVLAMAGTLTTIDLVITVDTMMAHLAGALGRPVWTLLPHRCDWRWMLDRENSPWYPTMRLFRQRRPGDWMSVVRQLDRSLRELITQTNPAAPQPSQIPPYRPAPTPEAREA